MAQIPYRANLSAATFPLSLQKAGRTVIFPGVDQNFDRRVDPAGDTSKDVGIPQAVYMENVIPTYNGYQSVGWKGSEDYPSLPAGDDQFVFIEVPVYSGGAGAGVTVFLAFSTVANNVYYSISDPIGSPFNLCTVPGTYAAPDSTTFRNQANVSVAFVQGRTFCYVRESGGVALYEITYGIGIIFTEVTGTVTGLTITVSPSMYILGSFNYLIFVDSDTVYWSSLTNPLDFTPSLVTGAGFEQISTQSAQINFGVEHPGGFIIYTDVECIAAKYTGNRAYPWRFTEILNSSGVKRRERVHGGQNTGVHYYIAMSGAILAQNLDSAETIISDVSDYLQNNKIHTVFDSGAMTLTTERVPNQSIDYGASAGNNLYSMFTAITFVLDRYVVISYLKKWLGATQPPYSLAYTSALVYDVVLRRLGRLQMEHNYVYEADGKLQTFLGYEYATGLGRIQQMFTDITDQVLTGEGMLYRMSGVLVLGKFQYARDRFLTLEQIEIESVQSGMIIDDTLIHSTFVIGTLDGKTLQTTVYPDLMLYSDFLIAYNCHFTYKNFLVGIYGAFDVSSIQLHVVPDGKF
jgi:hypothetical protein